MTAPTNTNAASAGATSSADDSTRILALIRQMYADYMTGNRAGIDEALASEFTMFDSAHPGLIEGFDELGAVRAERPAGSGVPSEILTAFDERVIVTGDTAIAAYWLRVDFNGVAGGDETPELCRITAVLRLFEGTWKIVHLHEDVVAPPK